MATHDSFSSFRPGIVGQPIREALAAYPHLALDRLPSYSPQLKVIERFWKVLRRRTTHNRVFETIAERHSALHASLCHYQMLLHKVLSLIESRRPKK